MKAILAASAAALCLLAALVLVTSDADARLVPATLLGKTQFLAGGLEVIDKKEGSGEAAKAGKTVKVIDGTHELARKNTHARAGNSVRGPGLWSACPGCDLPTRPASSSP